MAARQSDPSLHGGLISVGFPTVDIGVPGAGSITINGMAVTRNADGTMSVGNAITITGTPEFQAQVIGRLAAIANTPAGRTMLNTINTSGRQMSIITFAAANSDAAPNPHTWAGWQNAHPLGTPVFDGSGTPMMSGGTQAVGNGTGTNTQVRLNPNFTIANNLDPANPLSNDGIAFHEMNHGAHQMTGTVNNNPTPGWTTQEEQNTISTGAPPEADYLRQSGYPYQRTSHVLGSPFTTNP
jgi:hypothetical protein